MTTTLHSVSAAILRGVGAAIVGMNFFVAWRWLRYSQTGSGLPIVGGALLATGLSMCESVPTDLVVLPLLIDPGGVPSVLFALCWRVRRRKSRA